MIQNGNILQMIRRELKNPKDLRTLREILRRRYGLYLKKERLRVVDGELYYTGTIGLVTIYWMNGVCTARSKTSLDKERFDEDACFENSRKSAGRFAEGNKLASKVYSMLEKKDYQLFCSLKKLAISLIKEGRSLLEAETVLIDHLQSFGLVTERAQVDSETDAQSGTIIPACRVSDAGFRRKDWVPKGYETKTSNRKSSKSNSAARIQISVTPYKNYFKEMKPVTRKPFAINSS